MARVIKLKESDLSNLVRRLLSEEKGKRDENCTEIKVQEIKDVKRLLGNPKTMGALVSNYKKLYSGQSSTTGMPTPKEVMERSKQITGEGPKEPVVAMFWWIFAIVIGLMIILCVDWCPPIC